MTRRQAREQAFTLIFEKSFHPEITVEEMISMAVEARYLQTDEFAVLLAKTADEQQPEIDSIIEIMRSGGRKTVFPAFLSLCCGLLCVRCCLLRKCRRTFPSMRLLSLRSSMLHRRMPLLSTVCSAQLHESLRHSDERLSRN